MKSILIVCTTDSMIWNFLIPHIYELEKMGYSVECACARTGIYFEELTQKFHLTVTEIDFKRSPYSFKNVLAFFRLRALIREKDYDLIFCHEPVGGMMGRLAGKNCHKKVIYMAHGFHFFTGAPLKNWIIYYTAEYLLSFLTDVCITINQEDYRRSKKMHAKRCYYVHGIGIQNKINQIPVPADELRRQLKIGKNDRVLISVGELSKRKNHIVILKALKKIPDQGVKLIICGEGALQEKLREKAEKMGIHSRIRFVGFVKNVEDYLRISDIFIYPSLWEGLGIAGLEAMENDVPVIASNRRGIKDYIIDHKTGLLFEPSDYNGLSVLINMLLQNKEMRKTLSENAREILPQFEIEMVKKELRSIYEKEF